MSDVLTFGYTNWRGETALRSVTASSARFWFGATEWHPGEQMLLRAFDLDKGEHRDFAVKCQIALKADPFSRGMLAPVG